MLRPRSSQPSGVFAGPMSGHPSLEATSISFTGLLFGKGFSDMIISCSPLNFLTYYVYTTLDSLKIQKGKYYSCLIETHEHGLKTTIPWQHERVCQRKAEPTPFCGRQLLKRNTGETLASAFRSNSALPSFLPPLRSDGSSMYS